MAELFVGDKDGDCVVMLKVGLRVGLRVGGYVWFKLMLNVGL